jgi:predicted RNase H-like HicB family nuclease
MGCIVVTFHVHEEDGQYASLCPELGTASCGASIDEAFRNIAEATLQYLNAIEASGQRERIFRRRKIPIYPGEPPEERRVVLAGNRDFVGSGVLPIAAATGGQRGAVAAML